MRGLEVGIERVIGTSPPKVCAAIDARGQK
jgi:hypothetical protein